MNDGCALSFDEHVQRLRAGDVEAIRQFVSKYEPYIRRTIRFRIQRSALQPVADSVDVCQSVMGSVLLRLVAGEFELQSEQDLRNLLMAIANKKFLMLARYEAAEKRARSRTKYLRDLPEPANYRPDDPAQPLLCEELLVEVAKRLSKQEADLLRRRQQGLSWNQIGSELQEEPMVLRQRLSRALRGVAVQLGIG